MFFFSDFLFSGIIFYDLKSYFFINKTEKKLKIDFSNVFEKSILFLFEKKIQ